METESRNSCAVRRESDRAWVPVWRRNRVLLWGADANEAANHARFVASHTHNKQRSRPIPRTPAQIKPTSVYIEPRQDSNQW